GLQLCQIRVHAFVLIVVMARSGFLLNGPAIHGNISANAFILPCSSVDSVSTIFVFHAVNGIVLASLRVS
ncbi:MAG: hypothetical protein WBN81_07205, partial [Gammaproteobacteria bacterium]